MRLTFWEYPRLTLLGRALLLLSAELLANAACWILAGVLFGRHVSTRPLLSLALLAWTIGLRHALDADHISAIDNATRGLIALGQFPVTCGLYFSLGHSTIVIIVNIAIAISSDLYGKLGRVGSVGSIIGAAVSGSFLFIVGVANSVLLWKIITQRRQHKPLGQQGQMESVEEQHHNTVLVRMLGPIMTLIDRPWKMYPVGFLFGLGFDTASSIALLAVSAIAKKGSDGKPIPSSHVLLLPLLFTAAMTLVDSIDSILMLYSYTGFANRSLALFERPPTPRRLENVRPPVEEQRCFSPSERKSRPIDGAVESPVSPISEVPVRQAFEINAIAAFTPAATQETGEPVVRGVGEKTGRNRRVEKNVTSGLSLILTLLSILMAFRCVLFDHEPLDSRLFLRGVAHPPQTTNTTKTKCWESVSIITLMGLIGMTCKPCQRAADAKNGGGLGGRWWRTWRKANKNSGIIGAGIVGMFVFVVSAWYGGRWVWKRVGRRVKRLPCSSQGGALHSTLP